MKENTSFRGTGRRAFETGGRLSQQETDLLKEENEINALFTTPMTIEQLREKGGPEILAKKYEPLFLPFLNENGGADNITLKQCYDFGKANNINIEPIVLLAAAQEADKLRKSKLQ